MGTPRSWKLALGSVAGSLALASGWLVTPGVAEAATVSQTFAATGGLQTYLVPGGICGVSLEVTGASGGASLDLSGTSEQGATAPGGLGAVVSAHVPVDPGTTLDIVVGQSGVTGTGGTPFGGTGGAGGYGGGGGGGLFAAGGGGGASAVYDANGPLVTAGAGGGGFGYAAAGGGNAGVLHHRAAPGVTGAIGTQSFLGGTGGTTGGVGGTGADGTAANFGGFSAGGGGGAVSGGASVDGGPGGAGSGPVTLTGGGGGSASRSGDVHPGNDGGAGQSGTGGLGYSSFGGSGGTGGAGTALGGDGANSPSDTSFPGFTGGGGGGGGVGFGGGGGAFLGGGGGGGLGGGGAGFGGGGGGSSWLTPHATAVAASLAPSHGDGSVTVSYDAVADACPPTVLPGYAVVAAPTSGIADLAVPVTLDTVSTSTVTVHWTTLFVPGAATNPWLGPEAPVTDYTPSSGTVTFAPGDASATVHIPVLADSSSSSPDEYLVISFSAPTNARIGGFWGLGFGVITPAP